MTDRTEGQAPSGGGIPRALKTGAGWLLAIGAAFFGAGLATCGYHLVSGGGEEEEEGLESRPTTDVVVAVRDLAELDSAEYHMERVIDLEDKQKSLFGLVESQDAILMVAAADVTAGVDLTEMRDGDVEVDTKNRTARIVLPPVRVLSTRIDNERTFVHTRNTDLLAKRNENLESEARKEAERTLTEAAIEAGILDRARKNAETTVETLVRSLGYDQITIEHRSE